MFILILLAQQNNSTSYNMLSCTFVAPADYQTVERELTFNSGTTRIPVSIPIQSDRIDESDETFRVVLSQEVPTSTVTLIPATSTVTITDDDGKNYAIHGFALTCTIAVGCL